MTDTVQNLAAITSQLSTIFKDKIVRQINRRATLLRVLPFQLGAGKAINWDVNTSGMVTETFTDGADATAFGSDVPVNVTLNWALYRANFHLSELAVAAAQSNRGPAGLADLVAKNMYDAAEALASKMNVDAFGGSGSGGAMLGLASAISDSNVYAGINRATSPTNVYWRSYLVDPGSPATLTLDQVRLDLATIYTNGGYRPDIAVCDPTRFSHVKGLFDAGRRYNSEVTTARGTQTLENSAGVVEIDGCQFIEDKDCTANAIYYLNTSAVHVEVLPHPSGFGWGQGLPADDGFGALMLSIGLSELGRNGASRRWSATSYPQLVVERPNQCGARLNVA